MSDPTTPERRAELRKLIAALGGGYDGPWKAVYDEGAEHGSIRLDEHEPVFPGAYVEVASTDQLGDIDNEEPDMVVPEYLAAVSPDVVTALLDALDQAQEELRRVVVQRDDQYDRRRIAEFERDRAKEALDRVRDLCQNTEGEWLDSDFNGNTVGDIRRALDGTS